MGIALAAAIVFAATDGRGSAARAADPPALDAARSSRYLQTLARDDGGYAWPGDADGHLTPTFAAVGTYRALGLQPPKADAVAAFVRAHHPQRGEKPEWELHEFDFQQVQALVWLGAGRAGRPSGAGWPDWAKPRAYLAQYEGTSTRPFERRWPACVSRRLLGLAGRRARRVRGLPRRPPAGDGSYNTAPAADDPADPGNVLNTLWAVRAAAEIGKPIAGGAETAKCAARDADRPRRAGTSRTARAWPARLAAGDADVVYTWAAVRALALLGETPADVGRVRRVPPLACTRAGGGFGDRAGLAGQPAGDVLRGRCARRTGARWTGARPKPRRAIGPRRHREPSCRAVVVYRSRSKPPAPAARPTRSNWPAASASICGARRTRKPGWIEAAQRVADERRVPVRFFVANEEYNTFFSVPGMGTYSHLSDLDRPGRRRFRPEPWPARSPRRLGRVPR